MPEEYKALVVVLGISLIVLWGMRHTFQGDSTPSREFQLRRSAWIAITMFQFLAHNFWLYAVLTAILAYKFARQTNHVVALYLGMLMAAPSIDVRIPGFGPIQSLFDVSHAYILSLFALIPAALRLAESPGAGVQMRSMDGVVLLFIAWMLWRQGLYDSFTVTARSLIPHLTTIWLPYYVASRIRLDRDTFREIATALAITGALIGCIAMFEWAKHWLLYGSVFTELGLPRPPYSTRNQALRATATGVHSILTGYVLMLCLIFTTSVYQDIRGRAKKLGLVACIGGGLLVTFSRGPWISTAAGLAVVMLLSPGLSKRLGRMIAGAIIVGIPILVSPLGESLVAYLPFVGTVDAETVDYRADLWDVSITVLLDHPWVGDFKYLLNPAMEQMRQGEGIIDMVNAYLQLAMPFGIIGLGLFCIALWVPPLHVMRIARATSATDPECARAGRALVGASVGITVLLATTSIAAVTRVFYFIVIGLCVNYYMRGWQPPLATPAGRTQPAVGNAPQRRDLSRKLGGVPNHPMRADATPPCPGRLTLWHEGLERSQ